MGQRTKGGIRATRKFRHKKQIKEIFPVVGLRDLSLVDYPNKICTYLIIPGCNFRCPFCPSKELIYESNSLERLSHKKIIQKLYPRLGFIDGVCLSGGEPTLHKNLPAFLQELRSIKSLIKIDTNGSRPQMLSFLLDKRLVDYVTIELIAPLSKYREITNSRIRIGLIENTIKLIRKSSIPHDFRTTVVPGYHDLKSIELIAQTIIGARKYIIKQFDPSKTLEPECQLIQPYSDNELKQIQDIVAPYFSETEIVY